MKNSTMKEIITNYQDMSYDNTNSAKSEIDEMNKSLIRAVCSNDMNACTQLLQAGANANTDIANGNSPLLIAVSKSYINVNIANLLIQHGANVDFLDDNLDSLLLCAVKSGREKKKCLELVKILTENGIDIDAQDEKNRTALFISILNGDLDTAKYLVANDADVNICNNDGEDALMAISASNIISLEKIEKFVKTLVDAGADVTKKDIEGWSALSNLCSKHLIRSALLLVEHGADLLAGGQSVCTPLEALDEYPFGSMQERKSVFKSLSRASAQYILRQGCFE